MAALAFTLDAVLVTRRRVREGGVTEDSGVEDGGDPGPALAEQRLPWSHTLVWVLYNITASLSIVITLGGMIKHNLINL